MKSRPYEEGSIDSMTPIHHPSKMRFLVACSTCKRQYDASKLKEGSQFRCLCGTSLTVPQSRPHDADVVRCSSCGGPRLQGKPSCAFCNADFTLHERDLHTICPGCMTRVSDRAKYCHHCACPLLPAAEAGQPTEHLCPACGDSTELTSRRIDTAGVTVLECPRCAGLWVNGDEFAVLTEKSRSIGSPFEREQSPLPNTVAPSNTAPTPSEPLYRPCPLCSKLMNRRNYGRRSGVIIDSCGGHGIWFDAHELDRVLRWIRSGGEAAAKRRDKEEKASEKRQVESQRFYEISESDSARYAGGPGAMAELLRWLSGAFFN